MSCATGEIFNFLELLSEFDGSIFKFFFKHKNQKAVSISCWYFNGFNDEIPVSATCKVFDEKLWLAIVSNLTKTKTLSFKNYKLFKILVFLEMINPSANEFWLVVIREREKLCSATKLQNFFYYRMSVERESNA